VSNNLKKFGSSWYRQGGTDLLEILQAQETIDYIIERTRSFIVQQVTLELRRSLKKTFK